MNPFWYDHMACRDVDPRIFDGTEDRSAAQRGRRYVIDWSEARETCGRCPVTAECLDYVTSQPIEWGTDNAFAAGKTPHELRVERRKRGRR